MLRLAIPFTTSLTLTLTLTLTLILIGCDSTSDTPTVDAPIAIAIDASAVDGPPGTLATVVDCAGLTPDAMVSWSLGPTPRTTTIAVGQVVKFYGLAEHTAWETSGLWSASGDDETCVRFDGPGVYNFYCYFHPDPGETGSITVE